MVGFSAIDLVTDMTSSKENEDLLNGDDKLELPSRKLTTTEMINFENLTFQRSDDLSEEGYQFLNDVSRHAQTAFQPIVDIHTGRVFGYEALLRGADKIGFGSIFDLFDRAYDLRVLRRMDLILRKKAFEKFVTLPRTNKTKLFYNIDNRAIGFSNSYKGMTKELMSHFGLPPSVLCIEISERHEVSMKMAEENLKSLRDASYSSALDDFGAGYSGLKLLQDHQPDFIKIDRSFIASIDRDKKKKLLVATITDLAHVLGIFVVAEGIETQEEYVACQEIGCDLAQGYFVERPSTDTTQFQLEYTEMAALSRRKLKADSEDAHIISEEIEYRPPLRIDDTMETVIEAFRANKELTFFPVVDEGGSPMGIVREHTLKEFTYSPFGKDLMANKGTGINLRRFISPCPVADVQSSAQSILENYSLSKSSEGVILVKEFNYLGFLSTASLLRVINEKNLAAARDSNPLTKLPGNASIAALVGDIVEASSDTWSLVYLDLDNFKAFNDAYGFRQGDRAIMLMAQLMAKYFSADGDFIGHVGGDDFFLAFPNKQAEQVKDEITGLLQAFERDVESFYDAEVREQGFLEGKDRHGQTRRFPLMSCSAAIIHLPAGRGVEEAGHEQLDMAIARYKKKAKSSADHIALFSF